MIEVFVSRLGLDSGSNSYVVVLQEKEGPRLLPIWIGQPEAESIVVHMHNVKRARPMTHDLVRSLIVGMGALLRRVFISEVRDRTYFAELQIQRDDRLINIDARPSDGIAIALRLGAPIFAAEDLLVQPEENDDTEEREASSSEFSVAGPMEPSDEEPSDAELTTEQLKRYLETLRPEDFGKFTP